MRCRGPGEVFGGQVGLGRQEGARHHGVATERRGHQRSAAALVAQVGVRAAAEEQLARSGVAAKRRSHQAGCALEIRGVDVRALVEQNAEGVDAS